MNRIQEQLVALAAVFQAASLVDKIAKTGQASTPATSCLLVALLVRNPQTTLDVFGGDDLNLSEGYRALANALQRDPANLQRDPLKYALSLITLERQLAGREDLLEIIGSRLDKIQLQADQFGISHDNVIAACGALYQDTISTFRLRIQVQGDMRFLQQAGNAARIRALLLSGIRSARLWRQLGGHRWQLVFSRSRLLKELPPLMRNTSL